MPEVKVVQRSEEWFELRKGVCLTASEFGEALGVGKGRPYDFLLHVLSRHSQDRGEDESQFTKHGVTWEPIIDEAYQLLTGHVTRTSGFWVPEDDSPLHGRVGASPDAKVFTADGSVWSGLVEYKAPYYKIYSPSQSASHGIPRHYMAQMQGQMALCQKPWCDFMALCTRTREIMLKRVYFQRYYWTAASKVILNFTQVYQEARHRQGQGLSPLDFLAAHRLKQRPLCRTPLPGEAAITVDNLLETDANGRFRAKGGAWMTYEFLVGEPLTLSPELSDYCEQLLQRVDEALDQKGAESQDQAEKGPASTV